MMDLYHNTIMVSKIIRFGGNKLNRFKLPIIREAITREKTKYLEEHKKYKELLKKYKEEVK